MANMDKIADKIQKLLNLAGNNPNEEEAKSALLKAQELMAKYNIEQSDLNGSEEIKYSLEMCKGKVGPRTKKLCVIIANSFAVRPIISMNRICFFGREDNAKAAKSSMEFVVKVLEKGIRRVCTERGMKSSESGASLVYNAYALGFIKGLKDSLDAQTTALAIVVPKDVNEAFDKRFPDRCNARSKGMTYGRYEKDAYDKGMRDGASAMGKRSLRA